MELSWVIAASNLLCAFIVGAVSIPMIRRRVPPNRWYGVRFRRAFESEEAWYAINHYGGLVLLRLSVVVALVSLLGLLPPMNRLEWAQIGFAFVPLLYLAGLIPILRFANRWPKS